MNGCFLENVKYYKSKDYVIISKGSFCYSNNFPRYYRMFDRDITRIIDLSEEDYCIDQYIVGNSWEPCSTEEIKRVNELLLKHNLGFSSCSHTVGDLVTINNFRRGSVIESIEHKNLIVVLDSVDKDFIYYQAKLTSESFEIKKGKFSRLNYKNWIILSSFSEEYSIMNHLLDERGYKSEEGKLVKLYYYILLDEESPRIYTTTDYPTSFGNNSNTRIYSTYRDAKKDLFIILVRNERGEDFINRMKNSRADKFYYLDENLTIKSCAYDDSNRKFLLEQVSKFNAFISEIEARDFSEFLKESAKVNYKPNNEFK